MSVTKDEEPIPNPYLAALREARDTVGPLASSLATDLDRARQAMDEGAWVSTTADTFYAELADHRLTLDSAGGAAVDEIAAAIRWRPEMVDPHSRDGRWRP